MDHGTLELMVSIHENIESSVCGLIYTRTPKSRSSYNMSRDSKIQPVYILPLLPINNGRISTMQQLMSAGADTANDDLGPRRVVEDGVADMTVFEVGLM